MGKGLVLLACVFSPLHSHAIVHSMNRSSTFCSVSEFQGGGEVVTLSVVW
jgi:hypothetical protein